MGANHNSLRLSFSVRLGTCFVLQFVSIFAGQGDFDLYVSRRYHEWQDNFNRQRNNNCECLTRNNTPNQLGVRTTECLGGSSRFTVEATCGAFVGEPIWYSDTTTINTDIDNETTIMMCRQEYSDSDCTVPLLPLPMDTHDPCRSGSRPMRTCVGRDDHFHLPNWCIKNITATTNDDSSFVSVSSSSSSSSSSLSFDSNFIIPMIKQSWFGTLQECKVGINASAVGYFPTHADFCLQGSVPTVQNIQIPGASRITIIQQQEYNEEEGKGNGNKVWRVESFVNQNCSLSSKNNSSTLDYEPLYPQRNVVCNMCNPSPDGQGFVFVDCENPVAYCQNLDVLPFVVRVVTFVEEDTTGQEEEQEPSSSSSLPTSTSVTIVPFWRPLGNMAIILLAAANVLEILF